MKYTIAIVWFARNLVALLVEIGTHSVCRYAKKRSAGVKGGRNFKRLGEHKQSQPSPSASPSMTHTLQAARPVAESVKAGRPD